MTVLQSKNTVCVESLKLLGDFWTLRIIDALRMGERRYCEIQRAVGNVNPVTLTNRLQKLEKANLIKRAEDQADKVAVIYSLTKNGQAAVPVLDALGEFSKKVN